MTSHRFGLGLLTVAALLAGCGGAAATHPATPPASAAPAPSPTAVVSCASLKPIIRRLVSDQASQNASEEENWITTFNSDPTEQGDDLQQAINETASATAAQGQAGADAAALNSDASAFFSQNSGGLYPGWTGEYDAIKADIGRLAADCGVTAEAG